MKEKAEIRNIGLRVRVNEDEKERIINNVNACSFKSTSSFLRVLGLGYEPKSTLDQQNILALAKVNGDQGRLAGLLKMWLTNEERHDPVTYAAVKKVILEIEDVQAELWEAVNRL